MFRAERATPPNPENTDNPSGIAARLRQATGVDAAVGQVVAAGTAAVAAAEAAIEAGQEVSALANRGLRAMLSPAMIAGTITEAAWVTAHLATYPLGLFGDRDTARGYGIEHLSPVQRGLIMHDVEAAGTPILLVHGLIDNRSIFTLLRMGLQRRGFGHVSTMNYSPLAGDVRVVAARLAEEVERLVAETGYERIHIIGHSLGGIIARYYVTRLGGDERVHTLVTLGSPHAGTVIAYAWPGQITTQLRPGSGLMKELAQPAPGCATRFLAYWSDLDQLVFPHPNAAIDHPDLDARNIALHGVGHASIPNIRSVVHGISTALAHLNSDGSTTAAGVTALASATERRQQSERPTRNTRPARHRAPAARRDR